MSHEQRYGGTVEHPPIPPGGGALVRHPGQRPARSRPVCRPATAPEPRPDDEDPTMPPTTGEVPQ